MSAYHTEGNCDERLMLQNRFQTHLKKNEMKKIFIKKKKIVQKSKLIGILENYARTLCKIANISRINCSFIITLVGKYWHLVLRNCYTELKTYNSLSLTET